MEVEFEVANHLKDKDNSKYNSYGKCRGCDANVQWRRRKVANHLNTCLQ